jgi:hypothetical protein
MHNYLYSPIENGMVGPYKEKRQALVPALTLIQWEAGLLRVCQTIHPRSFQHKAMEFVVFNKRRKTFASRPKHGKLYKITGMSGSGPSNSRIGGLKVCKEVIGDFPGLI